ncbi:unnamed protein product, partial [Prorocentrum cordatum]
MYEEIKERVEGITSDILDEFTKDATPQNNALAHYIDLVANHADAAPANEEEPYKTAAENYDRSGVPLQFASVDGHDGAKTILKHIALKSPERKMKLGPFTELAYGTPRRLIFVHPKIGTKVWQRAFTDFGGKQFRHFFLSPEAKAKATQNAFYEKSDEEINAGFDYITNEAPKSTVGLQQVRWQTIAMRAGMPIHGWPIGLVEKSQRSLAAEGALANKEFGNNVTLCDDHFNLRVLEAMTELINGNGSLALIGGPNVGMTPLGRAHLMAMCRRNARANGLDPARCSIRVTPEIDFMRGKPGDIMMGGVVDDGCSNLLPPKIAKALLDAGQYEGMCWARSRCMADQTHDPNAEKPDRCLSATFQEFFELEKDAPRINFKGETFLTAEGERLCQLQKDGDMTPPDKIDQLLEKERLLVDSAVEKNRKRSSDAAAGALPAPSFAQ